MPTRSAPTSAEPDSVAILVPRLESMPHGIDWFTMHEVARIKGVSYTTVSRAVRTKKLAARRTGRLVLISEFDLATWEPMRARAPHRYRHRQPNPESAHGLLELANGEGFELARRVTSHVESIQRSALSDSTSVFTRVIADHFALAMEFERVAVWLVDPLRTHIELAASYGTWFAPGVAPDAPVRINYDPKKIYVSPSGVYEGLCCWVSEPAPVRLGDTFSTTLIAHDQVLGYLLGDRNGESISLTAHQTTIGHDLATLISSIIALRRLPARN